jgi:hypothetical protein
VLDSDPRPSTYIDKGNNLMPNTAIFSFKIDEDGKVAVGHIFFGATKAAAEAGMRQHAEICPKYGPAWRTNQTTEFAREIEELPPADGDALEEWLDELMGESDEAEDDPIEMEREE